jgi:uncharacterized protein
MKVRVKHNHQVIADEILIADTMYTRLVGLMFRSSPPQRSQGLLLNPCNSIHTFFMRYSLDVVFLSKTNEVIKVIRNLKPWRMTWIYFRASKTLEVPAGALPASVLEGMRLEIDHV